MITSYSNIDVPFNLRHQCWFCGEPSSGHVEYPLRKAMVAKLPHPPIAIPACNECCSIKYTDEITSVSALREHVNHILIDKYAKHLGIGENWTEQELIESEFTGTALGGFGRSAWPMYLIAKQRVAFKGWPLCLDEIPLDIYDETNSFTFNGTDYLSITTCIDYFVKAIGVDKELLTQLTDIVSTARFGYALQIAKLNKRVSNSSRAEIIAEVAQQEIDKQEILLEQDKPEFIYSSNSEIEEVMISGSLAPSFAIEWALSKQVQNLEQLCSLEDDFFDEFAYLGGPEAFNSYHGLQLYLQSRENIEWIESHDPNKALWSQVHS